MDVIFWQITQIFKAIPVGFVEEYAIDTFPMKVCENIRANRCRIAPLNLEEGAILYADKGYADYEIEDLLKEVEKINLMPIRKNSKRFDPFKQFIAKMSRKFIETIGSCLNGLFPKKIHAVTLDGFLLKLTLFVLSFNLQQLIKKVAT